MGTACCQIPCAPQNRGGDCRPCPPTLSLSTKQAQGCPGAPPGQHTPHGQRAPTASHTHLLPLPRGPQRPQGLQEQEWVLAWGDKGHGRDSVVGWGPCRDH